MEQKILDFLKKEAIMTIAVADGDKPQSSVVLYTINDDFTMYFAVHTSSYKAQTLLKNPKISLSVWDHNEMLVQADGTVTVIEGKELQDMIFTRLASQISRAGEDFWPPVFRVSHDETYTVFEVKPHWLRSLDLTKPNLTEEKPPFYEVDFS